MARKYVALPYEYLEDMEELTDEEFGRLVRGLLRYSTTGEAIQPTGNERFFVKQVVRNEDRFRACFDEKANKRSESGKKAAAARWQKNANACERMQTQTNASNRNAVDAPIVLDIGVDIENRTNINNRTKDFDRFWAVYPKKVGKGEARKAFAKIKGVSVDVMINAVEAQKQSRQWTIEDGRYIPNPTTWLHQGRWEDEVETAGGGTKPTDLGDIDWLIEQGKA